MSDKYIGRRAVGKRSIGERWYFCAICDDPTPESETIVPQDPHPHAGFRVCLRDYDDLDWEANRRLHEPQVGRDEEFF
jgi:hypothetical protein